MRRRAEAAPSARERLMTSALSAFGSRGFEGASTHAIAVAAGVPQGLVRHHFGSKEGLWSATLDRALSRLYGDLSALPEGLTVAGWMALVDRHADLAAMVLQGVLEGGPRAAHTWSVGGPIAEQLVALQRRAQPDASPERVAMWIAASLAGPLLKRAGSEPGAAADRSLDVLFAWLTTSSAPAASGPFALAAARAKLRGTG